MKQAPNSNQVYYQWNGTADYSKKAKASAACLFSVERTDRRWFSLPHANESRKEREDNDTSQIKGKCYARVLADGEVWDCLEAGTDMVVSKRLKEFLEKRVGDDLSFLPIELRWKGSKRRMGGYYALIFNRFVRAYRSALAYELEMISKSRHSVLLAGDKIRGFLKSFFIRAELAEEMIAAGFTGLGLTNHYSKKKPGWIDGKPRVFPEAEQKPAKTPETPFDVCERIAKKAKSLEDGWQALIKAGAKMEKSPVWKTLAKLDPKKDLKMHVDWLVNGFESQPPMQKIIAFWFGVFDRYEEKTGESFATLYIAGSDRYEPDKRYSNQWAVRPQFFPSWRYASSPVMDAISTEAYELYDQEENDKLNDALTYFLVLGYAALLVRFSWEGAVKKIKYDFGETQYPIAVGFDEGGFIFIGSVGKEGFKEEK